MLTNVTSVIVAHDHPLRSIESSYADKNIIEELVRANKRLDTVILGHVIIGNEGGYFSLKDTQLMISWLENAKRFCIIYLNKDKCI